MAIGTSSRDGGKTSEAGHLRALYKALPGEVISGLAVSQRGAGANMSVDVAIGDAVIPRSDATYGHPAFNDAVKNIVIPTSDPSNPRRDMIVFYIDYGVTPSTGVSNNTNGVAAMKVVTGTPAGSPADPTDAAIQSSVGASNPYIKLARVRVGTGVTSISNSVVDDFRQFTPGPNTSSAGWLARSTAADHWAYSAWDSTNKTATITVADSTNYTLGQKVRYWQTTGGWKYGFITKLVSGTTIAVYHGTDYTLNNERIYLPAYSTEKAPFGFPLDPAKWTVTVTSTSTASITNSLWAAPGSISLSVPIGSWILLGHAVVTGTRASNTGNVQTALSESTSAVTSGYEDTISYVRFNVDGGASLENRIKKLYTTATTVNLITNAVITSAALSVSASAQHFIKAECAFL